MIELILTWADCDKSRHHGAEDSRFGFCFWYKLQEENEALGLSATRVGVEAFHI